MTGKLSPLQREEILARWLEGNRALAAGDVPESMEEIARDYGVTRQAIYWHVKGNPRPVHYQRCGFCCECGERAVSKGRCLSHYLKHRWHTDPEWRKRRQASQERYRLSRSPLFRSRVLAVVPAGRAVPVSDITATLFVRFGYASTVESPELLLAPVCRHLRALHAEGTIINTGYGFYRRAA